MSSNTSPEQPWPRPAVSVMVFRGATVLLGQRAKQPLRGIWSLPGGHIEPEETVLAAGQRELLEETGVSACVTGHAGTRDIVIRDTDGSLTAHYVLNVLVGDWVSGNGKAASDCLDVAWVPVRDLDDWPLTDGTAELIRETYAGRTAQLDASHEAG